MSEKIYQMITDKILELMSKGEIPWKKPWSGAGPMNMTSKREYRGINAFLLSCTGSTPYWLTFNQVKQLGGQVRKGEKAMPVIFWKWLEKKDSMSADGQKERFPLLRYYSVFNISQVDGIEAPKEDKEKNDLEPIPAAAKIVANMPQAPKVKHGGNRAFYTPTFDQVTLPEFENFIGAEEYYNTAFHELAHSTGHKTRLNRHKEEETSFSFGSHSYSKEELVAEMTAAFLCAVSGIEQATVENSAAYIQGWSKKLKDSPKMVVMAAAQAQKAADFILDKQFEGEE